MKTKQAAFIIFLFISIKAIGMDAKTQALLNVNPYTSMSSSSYIEGAHIESTRLNLFSDISYKVFKPEVNIKESAVKVPLVIMLHGCGQSAQSFVESTKMFPEAVKNNFMILAPQQSRLRNFFGCWSFYNDNNINGSKISELNELKSIIEKVSRDYPVDTDRIYITGISAGAGMANNLVINHPEMFKGVALSAAPSYGYNPDNETLHRMMYNTMGLEEDPTPTSPLMTPSKSAPYKTEELKTLSTVNFGQKSNGAEPKLEKVLIFHGKLDPMVDSSFANITHEQYSNVFSEDSQVSFTEVSDGSINDPLKTYSKKTILFEDGKEVESYTVNSMYHSWGGGDGRTFTAPKSIDQTQIILDKFDLIAEKEIHHCVKNFAKFL